MISLYCPFLLPQLQGGGIVLTYNKDIYKIYNEDSHGFLKKFPSKSVDFILTDPPYNIAKYSTGNIVIQGRKSLNNDIADWDSENIDIEYYANEFRRIIKDNGNIFIFAGYNQIGVWHEICDSIFDTFQIFVWHKKNPAPKIYRNGFLNSCEFIILLWNKGHKWNFSTQEQMHNFFECHICSYPERLTTPFHPAQKPLILLQHLMEVATCPNDIVLDPFMGVGSTGVAALRKKCRFIGIDYNLDYCTAANKRLGMELN